MEVNSTLLSLFSRNKPNKNPFHVISSLEPTQREKQPCMIRQLPRIPSDAVIPSPRPQKKKQKNISVGLTCSKRREIPPSTRGKHIRFGTRATKRLRKNYRVAAKVVQGKLFFCFFAALMFYKTISRYKLFKVIAQGAVLCVMFFRDTRPSQKAIQLFPPPPFGNNSFHVIKATGFSVEPLRRWLHS